MPSTVRLATVPIPSFITRSQSGRFRPTNSNIGISSIRHGCTHTTTRNTAYVTTTAARLLHRGRISNPIHFNFPTSVRSTLSLPLHRHHPRLPNLIRLRPHPDHLRQSQHQQKQPR